MQIGPVEALGPSSVAAGLQQVEGQAGASGAFLMQLDSSQALENLQTIATENLVDAYS
jgi:hypothetical protein